MCDQCYPGWAGAARWVLQSLGIGLMGTGLTVAALTVASRVLEWVATWRG